MKTAVVVTTYNRPDALQAVLAGYQEQRDTGFELVIADDGSTAATRELVEAFKTRASFPVKHVWHEDDGFRAAAIRNRALAATSADYIIFSDGDCVPAPYFVAQHRRLAEPGWFVTGNRALLTQALTDAVLSRPLEPENWGTADWLRQRLSGGLNRLAPVLRLPLGPLRKMRPQAWEGARSCNLGVWRVDLDRVDGFDASFSGWGKEDSDLLVRLLHAGVRRKDGGYATGVLHLWHPAVDRSRLAENEQRLARVIESRRVRAETGISSLENDEPLAMPGPGKMGV